MPEPLTFNVTKQLSENVTHTRVREPAAQAAQLFRLGYTATPNRPIVAEDFRDYGQRCDLSVLGYTSRDFRPEQKPIPDEFLKDAYGALGLSRDVERQFIAAHCTGINGARAEIIEERLHALDEAVLELHRRRAFV